MSKIKMYLSARISVDAHKWNNEVCDYLSEHFEIFKPQDHNPYNLDHRKFEKEVYQIDLNAMIDSEIGILLEPYGKDCAWEVGWYSRSKKPIVLYAHRDPTWIRDWMIKGGLDKVFVSDKTLYRMLLNDGIVGDKVEKIDSVKDLSKSVFNFLRQYKSQTYSS